MASAAFRSTTKRTSIGASAAADDSRSSGAHRRVRSVSRSSHRPPIEPDTSPPPPGTRGKFVNTARGGAFEISLDDLAIELFSSGERARGSEVSSFGATPALRRGRSVSRQAEERKSGGGSVVTGGSTARAVSERRRRSVSVVRYRASDSESDNSEKYTGQINCKGLNNGNKNQAAVHKQAVPSQQKGLRRSSSQRVFLSSNNDYSVRDNENLPKLVNGVGLQQNNLDISTVRRSYSTKLDQSEKRKQELLAQIMLEEQHGKELKRFVGEWLPSSEETCVSRRPSRPRKRSNDKRRVSKLLNEEVDKIIEDFISSVEDNTDISSFDDDRSDTSSTFGTTLRPNVMVHFGEPEHYRTPTRLGPLPAEMDDVLLPWLQWETNTDSPLQCKNKTIYPATPKTVLQYTIEETSNANKVEESNHSNSSSRGSWNPPLAESLSVETEASKTTKPAETCKSFSVDSEISNTTKPLETRKSQFLAIVPRRYKADINEYSASQSSDEILFDRWKLGARISSGGILLCEGSRGPILL